MLEKFGRNYKLTVMGLDGVEHVIEYPITMQFSIDRKALATVNSGRFILYNLNQDTRNQVYKDYFNMTKFLPMTVKAGYGEFLYTIFYGNVLEAISYRDEGQTNFMTEINGSDLQPAIASGFISRTVTDPISRPQLIDQLIGELPHAQRGAVATFDGEYKRGRVLLGNPWDFLQVETGNNAFIDSGHVHCLRNNDCFSGDITEISSETGMLGTPKRWQVWVMVDMVFEPSLQVGQIVHLNSRTQSKYNGDYKIYGVRHQGIISGATSGKCKTTVSLQTINQDLLNIIPGNFRA